jgi:hypothetical protein
MPIQFNEENDGKALVVHVSGKMVKADYHKLLDAHHRRQLPDWPSSDIAPSTDRPESRTIHCNPTLK